MYYLIGVIVVSAIVIFIVRKAGKARELAAYDRQVRDSIDEAL